MKELTIRGRLAARLPIFVFILVLLQPVMDIASYWVTELSLSNTPTLLLRFGVLGVTLLLGFVLSHRKKVYWIACGICLLLGAGHVFAAWQYGYSNPVSDLTNFVRVVQMPLTTLCLITFLRENKDSYRALVKAMLSALILILCVEALAALTHTEPHTYDDGHGSIGWFNNTNSQSAILSILTPVSLFWLYQKKGLKNPLFWAVLVASFIALFYFGTRLCYLALAASGAGLGISLLLRNLKDWKPACLLFLIVIGFVCLIPFSQMTLHQKSYENYQDQRQSNVQSQYSIDGLPKLNEPGISDEEYAARKVMWTQTLKPIYEMYCPNFVDYFGLERVLELYNYTYNIRTITAQRPQKLQFARLLMAESPVSAQLFGVELSRFEVDGRVYNIDRQCYENQTITYDVENDFHGIYFLYGYAGLALLLAFLAYFVFLIIAALIKDPKRYFTLDAASWGIAFLLCLVHVYCTAGVLRRPNASFYLSAVLAAIYYLVQIRDPLPKPLFRKRAK